MLQYLLLVRDEFIDHLLVHEQVLNRLCVFQVDHETQYPLLNLVSFQRVEFRDHKLLYNLHVSYHFGDWGGHL